MLIYKNMFSYYDPLNIVFLCGSKYVQNDPREKRNILKEYLELSIPGCRAIILEENFGFGRTNMQYLSYDDVFLKGLAQIEQLASLYANRIIIIHETISTAAELGMFAIDPALSKKICLLTPDDISIEEKKTSGFIRLAFMNKKAQETSIGKHIIYYPDIEVRRSSADKSDYYTYFHNNEIGEKLGEKITAFVSPKLAKKYIKISKSSFGKPTSNLNQVDYYIDAESKEVNVFVHADALKIQLLSLFFVEAFKKEFRQTKNITEHVTYICNRYEEILLNTIADLEGLDIQGYVIKTKLKNTTCKLRQAVGYYLYMLQAARLIRLEQKEELKTTQRRIRISGDIDACKSEIGDLIYEKDKTVFGRLNT